jgi:hypothetical protein
LLFIKKEDFNTKLIIKEISRFWLKFSVLKIMGKFLGFGFGKNTNYF